ncbi:MAG: MurT ligase domain-containing protein [Candidatus Nanogingivalis sp.]
MKNKSTILLGKTVQKVAKIKGGGSALPGLFIEKTNPNFIQNTLKKLPHGVVVISGTNGKTTTTKMVVELLESQGLRVFTNKTGSNFVRGVAAALLESVDFCGNLPADIAVLELDEAHATHFVKQIQPKYSLLLNVMRDQLDRFGEIDHTAKLLQVLGRATSGVVVLNGGDPLLGAENFGENFSAKIAKFGSHEKLAEFFPNDDELHSEKSQKPARSNSKFDYTLEDFSKNSAKINGEKFDLQISGIHNILNLTAAIGLICEILTNEKLNLSEKNLQKAIFEIKPAFGRGEIIKFGEQEIEIMLVKNPAGFRSNLKGADLENAEIMIAINDNYADGRDMSWLWDVDFSALKNVAQISGVRAYDMALRLFHDGVKFENSRIETDISKALAEFLKGENPQKKIFATYTAMLEIRKEISKLTDVEKIL